MENCHNSEVSDVQPRSYKMSLDLPVLWCVRSPLPREAIFGDTLADGKKIMNSLVVYPSLEVYIGFYLLKARDLAVATLLCIRQAVVTI